MFTFGIFTTHFPYIAMVAFYAYFLIFGVNKPSDNKAQVEKSHIVQVHIGNSVEVIADVSSCFYFSFSEEIPGYIFDRAKEKQKWKHFGVNKIFPQDYAENALFGRPPPVLA